MNELLQQIDDRIAELFGDITVRGLEYSLVVEINQLYELRNNLAYSGKVEPKVYNVDVDNVDDLTQRLTEMFNRGRVD